MQSPCTAHSRLACRGDAFAVQPLRVLRRGPGRKSLGVRAALDVNHAADAASSMLHAVQHFNLLSTIADAAPAVASPGSASGPFDFLADFFESALKVIDDGLEKAHVPYSYGFAIITLTILVKLATFPLSQQQVKSSVAVQALQPRLKELQARYAGEPETLQVETARLYKTAGVNPLAGCLPTLATIPVFIGLYKALSRAADEGLGQESFFWIPDLSGPTTLVDRASGAGLSWLFPFVDGHPPIGWGPSLSYLLMPALLVVSQFVSMQLAQPNQGKDADPQQQQTQAILKFLPFMIGWFSLNVPSGLTLYWFVNNILSTAQQLYLKSTTNIVVPENPVVNSGPVKPITVIKPKEERVKKVTGKDLNARRRRGDGSSESDAEGPIIEAEVVSSPSHAATAAAPQAQAAQQQQLQQAPQQSRGKGKKGDKFRANKAKEAAAKAAAMAEKVEAKKD